MANITKEVAYIQFGGRRPIGISDKPVFVGERGPIGAHLSTARGALKSGDKAKASYVGVALQAILEGRVAAMESVVNSAAYIEYYSSTGELIKSYIRADASYCEWNDISNLSSGRAIVPLMIHALTKTSGMDETKTLFKQAVGEYSTNKVVSYATLMELCDAFYFEWRNKKSNQVIEQDTFSAIEDIIKQSIRTGQYQPLEIFADEGLNTPDITLTTVTKKQSEEKTVSSDEKYASLKNGDYVVNYCWDIEQQSYIPPIEKLEKFVPNRQFFTLAELIHYSLNEVTERMTEGEYGVDAIQDDYVNTILVGKPGTGKSSLAEALGATFGMPVRTITVSKYTEEGTYQGLTKVSEGGFKFFETPFLDAYKNGGIILIEEFNLSDPAVMQGIVGQAIEKPFILYEDEHTEVRRHPLCVVICTMNTGTEGSREPNQAFVSRSADTFILDDPDEKLFMTILAGRGYKKADCKKVYGAYSKIQKYLTSSSVACEDIALSVSMRHCFAALRQMCKLGIPFKEAIYNTMIGAIAISDRGLAEKTFKDVIEVMKG